MSKKHIIIIFTAFVISFSTGIFTEIVLPLDDFTIKSYALSFSRDIAAYVKQDIFSAIIMFIFSLSIYLLPLTLILGLCKSFSLGFSAAFLLSNAKTKGLATALSVLIPRSLLKIPVYIIIISMSISLAGDIKEASADKRQLNRLIKEYALKYMLCFFLLVISSILEVFLLHAIL